MSETPGGWVRLGARTLSGAVVSVAAVAAVVVGIAAPWPAVTHHPVPVVAAPAPDDTLAVCDGAVFAAGRNAEHAEEVTVAAVQSPVPAVGSGAAQEVPLTSPDVTKFGGTSAYSAAPQGRTATELAAAASARIADPDLAGFSTDACRPPLFESWLVGGDTSTGTASLVLVTNPGGVTATIDVTVYGATGAVHPPGGNDVAIPAHTQRVIPLAGLAGEEESPVLQITATGAPVRASLQSSLVRTLVPGGIDQQAAVAAPEEQQVIPGVVVTTVPGEAGASDAATVLRVLSPDKAGKATVTVTAVGGSAPAMKPSTIPLDAGIPTELDLSGLAVGSYVVTVDATATSVAAVWQATGFGRDSDYAWFTSAPALDGPSLVAVPEGPSPMLQLSNTGDAKATVTLHAAVGADRTIDVPARGSASIAVTPATSWTVDPGGATGLHAQVTFAGAGQLAGYAVWPSDAAAAPVRVYP